MYQYYIDEQKQIYKVYEKANHVYRLLTFKDSKINKILASFNPTDIDFLFLMNTKKLNKLEEKEYLELIGS